MRAATARGTAALAPAADGSARPEFARRLAPRLRQASAGLAREARRLTAAPLRRARRGALGFPLTLGVTGLVFAAWLAQMTRPGMRVVTLLGGESATLSWPLAIARLPGSLFAPAPSLPVWGALAQVLVVFGLSESLVGRRRTITVALLATAAATGAGRLMRLLGPQSWVGLSHHATAVRDTGPSAAVVALLVYVCCACRAPRALLAVVATMLAEVAVKPNLAGREHVVAIAVGLLAAWGYRRWQVEPELAKARDLARSVIPAARSASQPAPLARLN